MRLLSQVSRTPEFLTSVSTAFGNVNYLTVTMFFYTLKLFEARSLSRSISGFSDCPSYFRPSVAPVKKLVAQCRPSLNCFEASTSPIHCQHLFLFIFSW